MGRVVVLSLGQGTLYDGFPVVTAQIGEADNPYHMKFTASLPPAPEIAELYRKWRSLYSAYYQRLTLRQEVDVDNDFEIEEAFVTHVSEVDLNDLCQQLSHRINAWLNIPEFRRIDQQLRTQLKPSEEIRLLIETNDNLLRRLPWHLWNLFEDYPNAEVALSASEYQQTRSSVNYTDKVRILAIFGNSQGIDISKDRNFLEKLSSQAEIEFLVEPKLEKFHDILWRKRWDILFFAGHSSSDEKACLQLNQTDEISFDQLKYALKRAINNGLKLAIFNSCDSLGLAQQLQELHIPQVIVMREPVPDVVAQEFLKYFLTEFSTGQSLYTAVRSGRERLQGLEGEFPCATWLPVICQNPAEVPMVWQKEQATVVTNVGRTNPERLEVRRVGMRKTKEGNWEEHPPRRTQRFLITCKQCWQILLVTVLVVTFVMGVRYLGFLQPWELHAYDNLVNLRPKNEKLDPRLLIITIDEADIQYQYQKNMNMRSSLSDEALAQLLQKLDQYQPKAIGIDIYHDFAVNPKYPSLATRLRQDERLFAVCKVSAPGDGAPDGILPPPEVPEERLGFSDFVADADSAARRQLIHLTPPLQSPCVAQYAFSYQLAKRYLETQGITPKINQQGNLQIGDVVFEQLTSHSGGYQGVDASGYQILLNYRSLPNADKIATQISLREFLNAQIKPELLESLKNRIVLIGVTAPSSSDNWETPYSFNALDNERQISGVFVQAHMISQIISAVLNRRPLLWWCSTWMEVLWVWAWSILGGIIAWRIHQPLYLGLSIFIAILALFSICFGIFIQAGWIPLVPSALGLMFSAVVLKVLPRPVVTNSKKMDAKLWAKTS